MSYDSKSERVLRQQLRIQELCVSTKEPQLYVVSGADLIVFIDEAVLEVKSSIFVDDSAVTSLPIAHANSIIVDSAAYTAGGDSKAIKFVGLGATLAVNDNLIIKYVCHQ